MKKVLCILLAALFLCAALPLTVSAAEVSSDTTGEDYPVLTLDVPYTVNITTPNEEPMFAFTPEESGVYLFYSDDYYDTFGNLYDENMNHLAKNDDGYNGYNFLIRYTLEAGKTYYLRVFVYNDETGSFPVIVKKGTTATGMVLSCGDSKTVTLGTNMSISVTYQPELAPWEAVIWTSSDESVVTVSNSGYVTAVSLGTATITATSENGLTASCVITVAAVPMVGDATGDGVVNIDDATALQSYLAEFDLPNPARLLQCGDVDGNGKITIRDVTAIQRYLAEFDNSYGIGNQINA